MSVAIFVESGHSANAMPYLGWKRCQDRVIAIRKSFLIQYWPWSHPAVSSEETLICLAVAAPINMGNVLAVCNTMPIDTKIAIKISIIKIALYSKSSPPSTFNKKDTKRANGKDRTGERERRERQCTGSFRSNVSPKFWFNDVIIWYTVSAHETISANEIERGTFYTLEIHRSCSCWSSWWGSSPQIQTHVWFNFNYPSPSWAVDQ